MTTRAAQAQEEKIRNVLYQFVLSALKAQLKGGSKHYDTMVGQLTTAQRHVGDGAALQRWYCALSKSASFIDPQLRVLLKYVM